MNFENYGLKPYGAIPNARQLEWYKRERMIFFHFGMNTFTGKEWGDGTESPSTFNPSELDVRQWVRVVKEAGFACAILTAKHHDGFCLWQTKYTEHSIKNSPYKNGKGDIVKEFTDACAEFGVKAGIYLSPWDRHEPSWGKNEYNDFYVGQLTELLTNYGKIWEVWWDGAGSTEAVYDWDRWASTVRTLQADAVIFGSLGATPYVDVRWVGNEKGIAGKPCYATIDEISLIVETTSELNSGKVNGERFIPAEVDVSIRPGWFYHSEQDEMVRTPQNLMELYFNSNGSNAGLLLNLPPDRRGLVHEKDVESMLEFKRMLDNMLSNNLAIGATVSASTQRQGCEAQNLLNGGIFAPLDNDKAPYIEIELDAEKEINVISICEEVSLGQRITALRAYALVDNGYKELFLSRCVGNRLSQRFDKVKTKKVCIEIEEFLDDPVLKELGIYMYSGDEGAKNTSNVKNSGNLITENAEISLTSGEIDVNLGGIMPFNKITVDNVSPCSYELLIFNGFSFESELKAASSEGSIEIKLDRVIDGAYRFKIVTDTDVSDAKIGVYNE